MSEDNHMRYITSRLFWMWGIITLISYISVHPIPTYDTGLSNWYLLRVTVFASTLGATIGCMLCYIMFWFMKE